MPFRRLALSALAAVLACHAPGVFSAEITVERSEKGAVVKIDGQLFTEYVTRSGTKPILWPIIGPTGKEMTRDYPMRQRPGEKNDHPHHRSLWFTHGNVNGTDFWAEPGLAKKPGVIKHVKFVKLASGRPAVIVTQNDWIGNDGRRVCRDQRTLRFDTDGDARWIDFNIDLHASDGPVTFADDKEGTFGVRVAKSMCVDARRGGKIINSRGQTDAAAWGKPASWVDYHGPVDDATVGIAIFNHPSSFRYPTYWHVRTYGLFAANPFGLHAFANARVGAGTYTLPAGETMSLRYRVFLHRGDERQGKIREAFAVYASEAE